MPTAATLPFPLAGAGKHEQSWHSPTPSLKRTDTQGRHSHAALLSPQARIVKSFSWCLPEAREQALPPTFSSHLAKASRHAQSTEGTPLDLLALVANGAGIPELHGTVTIRNRVLARLPPSEHCMHSRMKHSPSLPMKKTYLLDMELHPEGQASGFPHI